MIYIVALGIGFKCPHKIHLNTQCPGPPGSGITGYVHNKLLHECGHTESIIPFFNSRRNRKRNNSLGSTPIDAYLRSPIMAMVEKQTKLGKQFSWQQGRELRQFTI